MLGARKLLMKATDRGVGLRDPSFPKALAAGDEGFSAYWLSAAKEDVPIREAGLYR